MAKLIVSKKDAGKYGAKNDAAGNYAVPSKTLSAKNQKTLSEIRKGGANQEATGAAGNMKVSGKKLVPKFVPTSPVLSSGDMSAQFDKNSTDLDKLTTPLTTTTPTNDAMKIGKPEAVPGLKPERQPGTDEYGKGIQSYYDDAEKEVTKKKDQWHSDVDTLFNTRRAQADSQYAASVDSIKSSYTRLIETQSKINKQVIDRTQAYGASSGNALYTPFEFTDAVAIKEREAANEIAGLESERNAKLSQALADRNEGRALALADKLKDIREIDDTIYSRMNDIEKEVQRREKLQLEAWKDLETKQKAAAAEMLELYKGRYLDEFRNAKTWEEKQKIIERVAGETGGALSQGMIFAEFGSASTAALKAEQDQKKFDLDVKDKETTIAKRNQDMALDLRKQSLDETKEARIAREAKEKEKVDKGFKFSNDNRAALLGSGLAEEDIDAMQEDVRKYGANKVLDGITDDKQKSALKASLKIREEVVNDQYIKDTFSDTTLRAAAKEAGFTKGASMWRNDDGVGEEGLNEYVSDLMSKVSLWRRAGKTEEEIIKEIEKLVTGE